MALKRRFRTVSHFGGTVIFSWRSTPASLECGGFARIR
jgi:hypothetical protein